MDVKIPLTSVLEQLVIGFYTASIPEKRVNLVNIPLTMKSLRDYSEARGKERC